MSGVWAMARPPADEDLDLEAVLVRDFFSGTSSAAPGVNGMITIYF
jgi:hypothetical protein